MESGESGSMEDKVVFKGLTVQEFIHPGEEEAKRSLIQNPAYYNKFGQESRAASPAFSPSRA